MLDVINTLCALGERQGDTALRAADYISAYLNELKIQFTTIEYSTAIPNVISSYLLINGKEVEARSCSFVGGKIDKDSQIITSLQSSQNHFYKPNINFNEKCRAISTPNYYSAPALAINFTDLESVKNAGSIEGECIVNRQDCIAKQILVGNLASPKHILFCHFDSLFQGAVDNASGVAVLLNLIQQNPHLVRENLFVFDGNEELSYDTGIYWGHGYREFQRRFDPLLQSAKGIIVVDCVGYDTPSYYHTPEIIKLAFPILNPESYTHKCEVISGGVDLMMSFYHSEIDTPKLITSEALREVVEYLEKKFSDYV